MQSTPVKNVSNQKASLTDIPTLRKRAREHIEGGAVTSGYAADREVAAALRATGKVERTPGGPRGRTSKLTPAVRQDLRSWIGEQSDLTLAELRDRLYQQQQIQVGSTQLWTVLRAMGVRLKKSRSTPPSKTR